MVNSIVKIMYHKMSGELNSEINFLDASYCLLMFTVMIAPSTI